jgi:hypothetical protein
MADILKCGMEEIDDRKNPIECIIFYDFLKKLKKHVADKQNA